MVKNVQRVLSAICLLLFFFVALLMLLRMAPWVMVSDFGDQLLMSISPTVQAVILVAAIAMMLIIGSLAVRRLREEVHITRQTEQGSVTVVESAITRYIKQVAMDIDSVQAVRAEITSTRDGLVVDLYSRVLVTETLPEIEETIRARVREALEETLGLGVVAAINVIIESFQKAEGPPVASRVRTTIAPRPSGSRAVSREAGPAERPAASVPAESFDRAAAERGSPGSADLAVGEKAPEQPGDSEPQSGEESGASRFSWFFRRSKASDVESGPGAETPESGPAEKGD